MPEVKLVMEMFSSFSVKCKE